MRSEHVVFACDMYGKAVIGDRERVLACLKGLVADREKIARRVQSGVDVLVSQPLANGQVAAIGYCFGGLAVLELARAGAQLAGADWQLVVYGGAMHGFTHDVGPKGPGVAYDAAADARSFAAITAFLGEVFATSLPFAGR